MPHPEQPSSNSEVSPSLHELSVPVVETQTEDMLDVLSSQEAAEEQARLILDRFRRPSGLEMDPIGVSVEKHDEQLGELKQALDTLFSLAEKRSMPFSGGLWQELKSVLNIFYVDIADTIREKKALRAVERQESVLTTALASPESRSEALRVMGRMMYGMGDNPAIRTSYTSIAQVARKLTDSGLKVFVQNQNVLLESLKDDDDIGTQTLLAKILASGVTRQYESFGSTVLAESFFPIVAEKITQGSGASPDEHHLFGQYALAVAPLLSDAERPVRDNAEQLWVEAVLKERDTVCVAKIIEKQLPFFNKQGQLPDSVVTRLIERMGLRQDKFFDADKVESEKKGRKKKEEKQFRQRENYINNVVAAQALEHALSGSVARLSREYGIQTFARYPKELLLKQLEMENVESVPYGVVLNPREDWNSTFYGDKNVYQKLDADTTKAGMSMRIFECESIIDAAKKLIRLNRRYGGQQKIQFALVGGHGSRENLQFGRQRGGTFSRQLTESDAIKELRSFFADQAVVVLNSCSTGGDCGLASTLSHMQDITVIAPDNPTSLRSLRLSHQGEGLTVEVHYADSEQGKAVTARKYVAGVVTP